MDPSSKLLAMMMEHLVNQIFYNTSKIILILMSRMVKGIEITQVIVNYTNLNSKKGVNC